MEIVICTLPAMAGVVPNATVELHNRVSRYDKTGTTDEMKLGIEVDTSQFENLPDYPVPVSPTPGVVLSSSGMLRAVSNALRALRVVSVALAIAAMLCVSAASVSPSHAHLKEPVGNCDVCSTAHMAAQQIAVIQVVHALQLQNFLAPSLTIWRIDSRRILATLTRGPPSFL